MTYAFHKKVKKIFNLRYREVPESAVRKLVVIKNLCKSCREVERSVWVILMEKDNDKATQFMQFKKLL